MDRQTGSLLLFAPQGLDNPSYLYCVLKKMRKWIFSWITKKTQTSETNMRLNKRELKQEFSLLTCHRSLCFISNQASLAKDEKYLWFGTFSCFRNISHSHTDGYNRSYIDVDNDGEDRRPISSIDGAPDCRAGGRPFKSRPDQHSGPLNNWGKCNDTCKWSDVQVLSDKDYTP